MLPRLSGVLKNRLMQLNGIRRMAHDVGHHKHHESLDHIPLKFRPPTLNEFPLPQGSWQAHNAELQSKYNKQLVIGLSFFIFTVGYVVFSGVIDPVLAPPMKNTK